jgi:carbon monoxide dehydrogenase subunit G
MKLEHSFDVEAPLDRVWARLIDIEKVAPCLPGAEITDASDTGVYEGNFTIKLGPTTASYAGKLQMTEVDEIHHKVTMSANGRDKRGQGSAKAMVSSTMSEAEGTTHVDVVTDFTLTGRLARFGRGGMIEDVSNKMVGDFVECLRSSLESDSSAVGAADGDDAAAATGEATAAAEPPTAAQPVRGGRLFFSVLWMRIKRLFGAR